MAIDTIKTPTTAELNEIIDRLSAFHPTQMPFVSLYLNAQASDRGRDQWEPFLRKSLDDTVETFAPHTPERESFQRDADRINIYLQRELEASANGAAIFACSGENDFFRAVQLETPIDENQFIVDSAPHIYPLLKLVDAYNLYAVMLSDSHYARIFAIGLRRIQREESVEGVKTKHHKQGGWSQMRFQRQVENFHLKHAKEAVHALGKMVSREGIKHIILAGDGSIISEIKSYLPKELAEMLIDVLPMDIRTPEQEIIANTLDAFRLHHQEEAHERAEQLINAFRAQGLGVVGIKYTLEALNEGKADEIIIHNRYKVPESGFMCKHCGSLSGGQRQAKCPYCDSDETQEVNLREQMLAKARESDVTVTLVDESEPLLNAGGIGALLRYK